MYVCRGLRPSFSKTNQNKIESILRRVAPSGRRADRIRTSHAPCSTREINNWTLNPRDSAMTPILNKLLCT